MSGRCAIFRSLEVEVFIECFALYVLYLVVVVVVVGVGLVGKAAGGFLASVESSPAEPRLQLQCNVNLETE